MQATIATAFVLLMRTATACVYEFEVTGCQDAIACNFNADATDEDGFLYLC